MIKDNRTMENFLFALLRPVLITLLITLAIPFWTVAVLGFLVARVWRDWTIGEPMPILESNRDGNRLGVGSWHSTLNPSPASRIKCEDLATTQTA